MGGEDRDNRELEKQSKSVGRGIIGVGGEEGKRNPRKRVTQKILWEYLWGKEWNPAVKRRWCVGEGNGMEIAVVVCWSSDFFMEAVGWGLWPLATVTWRGEERETEVQCAPVWQQSEEPRRKKGTW